jgi:hypothetical protein
MPRPYLPNLVQSPKTIPFKLARGDKRNIARTIGVKSLSRNVVELIECNVVFYRATNAGSPSCTVANTGFALHQLEKKGRARQEALYLLSNDRAAVDYTTLNAIQSLAKAVLTEKPGAEDNLLQVARNRAAELRQHPRVVHTSEPLRFFCGVLREIFKVMTADHLKQTIPSEKAWKLCRCFAFAVFEAAGIERHHFFAHPERLTEYLRTDVTTD